MVRSRPRKPRLSRMDAAVDAMSQLGFPAERVTKHVKGLLKEYGGDEAWPFIEEYSYKELLEALLRESEEDGNQEKDGEDGLCLKDKFLENGTVAGTAGPSGEVVEPTNLTPVSNSSDHCSGDAISRSTISSLLDDSLVQNGLEHTLINYPSRNNNGETIDDSCRNSKNQVTGLLHHGSKNPIPALSNIPSPLPTNSRPPQRRVPCYGWIESDEDDDACDFISLKPSFGKLESKAASSQEHAKRVTSAVEPKRIRRSRWDVKPEDPKWP